MTTREEFINSASTALGRSSLPEPPAPLSYRHSVHTDVMKSLDRDELAKAFIDYSKTIGVDVFETTQSKLKQTLKQAVASCEPGTLVVADDPLLQQLDPAGLFSDVDVYVWDNKGTREKNIALAEKCTVGIAVAKRALAESATVLLFSHAGSGRSVTLLPKSTIYIIPKSVIVPRLTQGMAYVREHKDLLPSSVNFVSGPSATSDIELVRVVGVHGPVHVVHVVVNDL